MANPIQQGLKPDYRRADPGATVAAMANPIQQGLKHLSTGYEKMLIHGAAMANPIQQGLKLPRTYTKPQGIFVPQWLIQYNKD